jgi:hypothetical protein
MAYVLSSLLHTSKSKYKPKSIISNISFHVPIYMPLLMINVMLALTCAIVKNKYLRTTQLREHQTVPLAYLMPILCLPACSEN